MTASLPLLTLALATEHDVVLARQRTRQVAALLDFEPQDQARMATAVSEIARNAVRYAGGGRVELAVEPHAGAQHLMVRVTDRGRGIRDLDAVLEGRYVSPTGMGLGIVGARRLSDVFHLQSSADGTQVTLGRALPRRAGTVTHAGVARIAEALARQAPQSALEEVQAQNQELMRTLEELRNRQADVERLNRELEETNRGVVALYTELDDKAMQLRRASELKSAFLSNVSHELRTPLSSILNISRLMADHHGTLPEEHARQVALIRRSAQSLFDIVSDLLDLAKIEAGRVDVHPGEVSVADLFTALRGMFRPLVTTDAVTLVVDDPPPDLVLFTDEQKLSQVLRNLLSNALKYTERGEVRLSVSPGPGDTLEFAVRDTGIGIAPGDLDRVFEEFMQVEGPLQRRTKGTGLGLPLTRQLARLLGGTVDVASTPGEGSTFTVTVPRYLGQQAAEAAHGAAAEVTAS